MPRLIWVFAGRTLTLLVLSRGGSNVGLASWSTSLRTLVKGIIRGVQMSILSFVPKRALKVNEPQQDKTNKTTCAPSEDSDQSGHPPSLIRVFAVCSMSSQGPIVSSCGQRRLWPVWVDAKADPSLRWAHGSFCWFCYESYKSIYG